MSEDPYTIREANWARDRSRLRPVREAVFIQEQHVPPELEWDESDADALHVVAEDRSGRPVGTGRLTPDGHIGRLAVLETWRGRGVGAAMLEALMDAARRRGLPEVVLNAQVSAIGFYRRHGYTEAGEEFMDAGIPHRLMRCSLEGRHE